ncbi:MAG: MFS transporter [Peptococcaceae bacterium]|nr:MFS transporter [Peptococcaceae bacterium]
MESVTVTKTESGGRMATFVVLGVLIALIVDGMDLQMLSLALPVLMQDLHLSKVMAGSLGTWTFVGMGVGGVLSGWLADRFGRVKVTGWSLALFSVGTALLAFTSSYWQFAVIRCISGFGLAAVYIVGSMLAAEYVPTQRRTTILGSLQAGWSVGYVVAALVSSWILPNYGWRPLFVIAIIPAFASIWMLRSLSDPPGWAEARAAARAAESRRNEWAELWADRNSRKYFILWSITATALQFGYYGANTWLPSYIVKDLNVNLKSMGWYVAGTYAAMILGKVITGWLADKFGRRAMFTAAALGTALALPLIVKFATPSTVAVLLIVFGLFYGAPYAINATYMSESFPTSIRGTAMATSYNIGRVGSIISPVLIGAIATQYSIGMGIALLGIAYALTGLIPGLFIREKMYDPTKAS